MTYLKDSVKDGIYSTLSIGTEEKYRHEATGYNVGTVKPEEPPCNSNFIDKTWQKNKNLPFKAECTKIKSTSSSACFEEHWSDHSHTGDDQNVLHVCELLENEDFLPVHAAPNENCIPVCTNDQLSDDGFSVPMDTYGFCSADLYKSDTTDIGRTPTFDVAFSYGIPISDPCETAPVPSLRTPFQCIIGTQTEIINIQPEITSNSFSPSNQTTIGWKENSHGVRHAFSNRTDTKCHNHNCDLFPTAAEIERTDSPNETMMKTHAQHTPTNRLYTGKGIHEEVHTGEGEANSTVTGEGETNTTVKGEGETNTTVTGEGETNTTVTGEGETNSTVTGEGETNSTVTGEEDINSTVNGEGETNSTVIGEGETNNTVTGEGETNSTVTGEGETHSTVTGEGETNSTVTGEGETNSTVTGEGEINSTVTGEGEINSTVTGEGESKSENDKTFVGDGESNSQNEEKFAGEKEFNGHYDVTVVLERKSNSHNDATAAGEKECNNQNNETVSKEKEFNSQNNETFAEEKEFNCQNNEIFAGEKESKSHTDETFTEEKESNSQNNETLSGGKESNNQINETVSKEKESSSQNNETFAEEKKFNCQNNETLAGEKESNSHNDKTFAEEKESNSHNNGTFARQKESNSQNILTRADGRDPISQHDEMHTEDIGSDIRNDNICSEQGHPVDETHIDERENDNQNDEISAGGGTIDNQNNTKYVRIGRKCGSQRSGGLPTDSQIDETRVSRNTSDRHDKRHLMGKYEFNVEGGISYKVIYGNVNSVENLEVEFPNYNNAKIDRIRSCYKADTSREKGKGENQTETKEIHDCNKADIQDRGGTAGTLREETHSGGGTSYSHNDETHAGGKPHYRLKDETHRGDDTSRLNAVKDVGEGIFDIQVYEIEKAEVVRVGQIARTPASKMIRDSKNADILVEEGTYNSRHEIQSSKSIPNSQKNEIHKGVQISESYSDEMHAGERVRDSLNAEKPAEGGPLEISDTKRCVKEARTGDRNCDMEKFDCHNADPYTTEGVRGSQNSEGNQDNVEPITEGERLSSQQTVFPQDPPTVAATVVAGARPKKPDLCNSATRLKSFQSALSSYLVDREMLVDHGLYYTGDDAVVSCFSCHVTLDFSDRSVEIWILHILKSPYCRYLEQTIGRRSIDQICKKYIQKSATKLQNRPPDNTSTVSLNRPCDLRPSSHQNSPGYLGPSTHHNRPCDLHPSSHQNSPCDLRPLPHQNSPCDLRPSSHQNSPCDLRPSSHQNRPCDLRSSTHHNRPCDLRSTTYHNRPCDLRPSSHHNRPCDLRPSSHHNRPCDLRPSTHHNRPFDLRPSSHHNRPCDLRPSTHHNRPCDLRPSTHHNRPCDLRPSTHHNRPTADESRFQNFYISKNELRRQNKVWNQGEPSNTYDKGTQSIERHDVTLSGRQSSDLTDLNPIDGTYSRLQYAARETISSPVSEQVRFPSDHTVPFTDGCGEDVDGLAVLGRSYKVPFCHKERLMISSHRNGSPANGNGKTLKEHLIVSLGSDLLSFAMMQEFLDIFPILRGCKVFSNIDLPRPSPTLSNNGGVFVVYEDPRCRGGSEYAIGHFIVVRVVVEVTQNQAHVTVFDHLSLDDVNPRTIELIKELLYLQSGTTLTVNMFPVQRQLMDMDCGPMALNDVIQIKHMQMERLRGRFDQSQIRSHLRYCVEKARVI
ncbi:serine-rich adhesin for platelets-like isoform X2 [Argopecten irradians]|uniref:serine-rich adhesin for platelets-like isoform X2 n=1 Tax=Argopecten irradians TaxID=31199 RepID=UPI0037173640